MKPFGIILAAGLAMAASKAQAQLVKDPTTWTYEVKKKAGNQYDLIFHLKLDQGWHIWSLKPGGDGYQLPPKFSITPANGLKLIGKVTEKGKPVTTIMEGIDGKVTYFSNQVDFIQTVQVNGVVKVTGKHEYQVCNDNTCLPPKKKSFEFVIR